MGSPQAMTWMPRQSQSQSLSQSPSQSPRQSQSQRLSQAMNTGQTLWTLSQKVSHPPSQNRSQNPREPEPSRTSASCPCWQHWPPLACCKAGPMRARGLFQNIYVQINILWNPRCAFQNSFFKSWCHLSYSLLLGTEDV